MEKYLHKAHGPFLGVTTRLLPQVGTGDVHDALSQDWHRFLQMVGLPWLPLPNLGKDSVALAQGAEMKGFIFTGGGMSGEEPQRDATEAHLLTHARERGFPVLGVCRGFQALQRLLGGEVVPLAGHVRTHHELHPAVETRLFPHSRLVNSYHNFGILHAAPSLKPLAYSVDGDGIRHVEAAVGKGILGIMWHPERDALPQMSDITMVRDFLMGKCPAEIAGSVSHPPC